MSKSTFYTIIFILALILLVVKKGLASGLVKELGLSPVNSNNQNSPLVEAAKFIKPIEGFRKSPYWDYKQWTWGYGTKAPGKTGTITTEQAERELERELLQGLAELRQRLKKPQSFNQMIALLSFNFNLGIGNTALIINRINDGKSANEVTAAMKLYNKADGKILTGLVDRRQKEVNKYLS